MSINDLAAALRARRLRLLSPRRDGAGRPIWRSAYHQKAYHAAVEWWPGTRPSMLICDE